MRRFYSESEIGRSPKVMGVDVARFGDDTSVIFMRQGLQSYPMIKYRNIDSMQGAGVVARKCADWGADAVFIDATSGFVAGWFDQLQALRRAPGPVAFTCEARTQGRH